MQRSYLNRSGPTRAIAYTAITLAAVLILLSSGRSAAARDATQKTAPDTKRPPNILFILLDNLGKDWFRCYGSQEDETPNIDRLARSGLKFRDFYVTPVCSTTRVMLLTGRYPFSTGWHTHHDPAIYGGGYFDWRREVCLARVLRSAGYSTCISGKWQINDLFDPAQKDALKQHGFDEYCIFPEGKKGHPAHKKRYWDPYVIQNGRRLDTAGQFGPDIFREYLIDYMRRHRDRPFFAYFSTILTHIPVVHTPLNKGQELSAREQFVGMIRYADRQIALLVESLDELGLRDNTIVFIVVDNGTDNGTDQDDAHSLGGRINGMISGEGIYSLTERGINVPLIVNCPALVPGGRESDDLLDASDILPTLAELAGAKLVDGKLADAMMPNGPTVDGRSFAPQLLGKPADKPWRPWCLTQYYTTRVVRGERFKLYSTGRFHDLATDPLEQHDLSPQPLTDQQARAARARLQRVLDQLPPNAKLPWEFRSISARKIRKQEAEQRAKLNRSR